MRRAIIGGQEVEGNLRVKVINPSVGEPFEDVAADGNSELTKAAIDAAADSQEKFASLPIHERAKVLLRASEILNSRREEAARLLSMEGGKPIKDARIEISRAISILRIAAEEARFVLEGKIHRVDAYESPVGNENRLVLEVREPLGVVGAILPYNFPANSFAHKVAPNLAAGNAVIVKPASATPLSALFLASIMYEAGLPKGVLSVIPGPASAVGEEIVRNPKVFGITFTGSTDVGLGIASEASRRGKRVMMEMGGSDPMLILDDADLDVAVPTAIRARFEHAGQNCNSTKRILVHESLYERFLRAFINGVATLRVGNALEESTDMGPVISESSIRDMEGFVSDALERGGRLVVGGHRLNGGGFFFAPTVFTDVPPDARIMKEEVFGPIVPIYKFSSDSEAIEIANSTNFGLQASIFTRDYKRALKMASQIKAGAVMINDSTRLRWDALPFGGVKLSGLGAREGVRTTMEAMSEPKLISLRI